MAYTFTCRDCPYCWKDEKDRYPTCQFFRLTPWDIPPCEEEDDEYEGGEDEDDFTECAEG